MYALSNQHGQVEAFMEKNRIVAADSLQMIGILLGNCVFDCSGKMVGKFLDNVLYHLSGKILSKGALVPVTTEVEALLGQYQEEGAVVLRSITNHTDRWIEITTEWSKVELHNVLQREQELQGA
ncbi:hypothetical protein SAMN05421788_108258 [Filimonas lacunae]|uniref:Uncharacterized protein n=1 Tax=Filimonas lacunae TaxID=477680 RepID=A0A173MDP3_9BACT|nr:hypothetical protein [Filimonas lacunae]BAV05599.1 hypothetical protein FLA_1610 [Filimonas lacunae]SIT29244.1 hypothetical protein SAMN05421788_108258 [Filimonas lacunae]